ncbi:MAG: hypothetical protein VX627_04040 [Candidatus Thermoplasmatota archaeon]|nr:hypothetical protein [Candidatus Thermoplasmatota archaeon]
MERKKEMKVTGELSFASLVATRIPRQQQDGNLVHTSGSHENGNWRPMQRMKIWSHLHQRSLEAMA